MTRFVMGRRRLIGTASAIVAGLCLSVLAWGAVSDEAKVLIKLDDDWSAAAATRDAKRVASFYAEEAIAYPPNAPMAMGRAAAEKVWAAYFAEPTYNLSWRTTHAGVAGSIGYTTGTYQDSYKGPDGKMVNGKGKYVCVWEKQKDGTWKAIHDMWNTDTQ